MRIAFTVKINAYVPAAYIVMSQQEVQIKSVSSYCHLCQLHNTEMVNLINTNIPILPMASLTFAEAKVVAPPIMPMKYQVHTVQVTEGPP